MKFSRKIIVFILLFFIYVSPHVVFSVEPVALPGRLIIKFKNGLTDQLEKANLQKLDLVHSEKLRLEHTYVIAAESQKVGDILSKLAATKQIEYIEPDFVAQALEVPNDPDFSREWGLTKIQAPGAWSVTHGSGIKIAIVDTGIANHPDLQSKIVARSNFTTDTDSDGNGHGTHVAGIAAAATNNNLGVAGAGYDSQLLSVKVLSNTGQGYYSWIASGITWAVDNGAQVINLSLGGSYDSKTISDAISYAWSKGVVIVAAAGNSNNSNPVYPAYYDKVIAVGATDTSDKKAWFSNYGNWVDVAAPGVGIFSTYRNDYAEASGTSVATPFVSGVAALIKAHYPLWSNSDIRNKLEQSSDKIAQTGSYWTWGRVNACQAVDCILSVPGPTPTPSPNPTPSLLPSSSPLVSPLPTPSPALTQAIVYNINYDIQKKWSDVEKGNIYVNSTWLVTKGILIGAGFKIVPDQSGNWGEISNNTIYITINGKKYQTYLKWNKIEKSATIDLSQFGVTLKAGSRVDILGVGLINDTRGFHSVKLQIFDQGSLLRERVVSFSL